MCSRFQHLAHKFPQGSVAENVLHLLGEVEVVFGVWAAVLIASLALLLTPTEAVRYAESLNFTEPMFVFAIMTVAATKPIIDFARWAIFTAARFIPIHREVSVFASCLIVGPLLGSFITEPAAMTVTALILRDRYYRTPGVSTRFKYTTLAALFVNISIGGVLTPFAAPPVLMVASKWNWDISFMFFNFGWKATLAVLINALLATVFLKNELKMIAGNLTPPTATSSSPIWVTIVHLCTLTLVVATSHHPVIFIGVLLLFFGFTTATKEYQTELYIKQSLLVAFFLGGLVILGGLQSWWLAPLLTDRPDWLLFLGTTGLTAITDNAALTYLGSLLPNTGESFRYSLVAGAIAGGGLTVIANAPNPAGYSILQEGFGEDGIKPLYLFLFALPPTIVSMLVLWFAS
jgi:hypothetical protein